MPETPPLVPLHGQANSTIISRGSLSNFNPNTEAFETYVLRFEFFFTAECIDVKLKAAKFLSAIDGKSFTLALNLLHPRCYLRRNSLGINISL